MHPRPDPNLVIKILDIATNGPVLVWMILWGTENFRRRNLVIEQFSFDEHHNLRGCLEGYSIKLERRVILIEEPAVTTPWLPERYVFRVVIIFSHVEMGERPSRF